jgi:hypothetical protein
LLLHVCLNLHNVIELVVYLLMTLFELLRKDTLPDQTEIRFFLFHISHFFITLILYTYLIDFLPVKFFKYISI